MTLKINCPVCNTELTWEGVDLVCSNLNCGNRDEKDLIHWVSYIGDVDGLGKKLKNRVLEDNNITNLEDLYTKGFEDNFDNTSTGKKYSKFHRSLFVDKIDINLAMFSLNIPRFGWTTVCKIKWTELIIEDLSKKIINSELQSQLTPSTLKSLKENLHKCSILKYILSRLQYVTDDKAAPIRGKVAITGSLSIVRKEFEKILTENGWTLEGIGKETDFLITNQSSSSSKFKYAIANNIPIVSEQEFLEKYIR